LLLSSLYYSGYLYYELYRRSYKDDDKKKALENFKKCVNKKGKVCVQILNYDKILKEMKTQVSLKKTEKRTFHRFYTFNEKTVTFNLVIQSKKDNYKLKTELYPLKSGEFISICENVGFGKVDLYGDLQLNPFSKEDSENMVAFCLV